jgi:hypothetical protein
MFALCNNAILAPGRIAREDNEGMPEMAIRIIEKSSQTNALPSNCYTPSISWATLTLAPRSPNSSASPQATTDQLA